MMEKIVHLLQCSRPHIREHLSTTYQSAPVDNFRSYPPTPPTYIAKSRLTPLLQYQNMYRKTEYSITSIIVCKTNGNKLFYKNGHNFD